MVYPLHLAPLLYVPASRPDLGAILRGQKDLGMCSLAICLEDAVRPDARRSAAERLSEVLHGGDDLPRAVLIRPADAEALTLLLDTARLDRVSGFVLPKATPAKIHQWIQIIGGRFPIFPILESRETLDSGGRRELAEVCVEHRAAIPRVRIGANDLFALLGGLRRPRGCTVYETPLGRVVDELLEIFSARNLPLSGLVFDRLEDVGTLRREVVQDIQRGIFCKTALNPSQVAAIWEAYRPDEMELQEAHHILHPDSPAVFGLNGSMLEPACHAEWARRMIARDAMHRAAEMTMGAEKMNA